MRVREFDYTLPEAQIALRPAEPRESARLLDVDGDKLTDRVIADLPDLLSPGDLLVVNDTKVIPARLFGQRGMMRVEVMLERARASGDWEAFARPLKRLRVGDTITFAPDFAATVTAKDPASGSLSLRFAPPPGTTLHDALARYGHTPLPPYIARPDDAQDTVDYQTIFARQPGAVAAPTASLHLTPALMERLAARGIAHDTLTLHVGAGTYQPVRVDDTDQHVMHAEWVDVSARLIARIRDTQAKGGRVVAVGTTVLRALESSGLQPFQGETRLFITPGYRFTTADLLLTNFHLPQSTLLMLVSAFAGTDSIKKAYAHAIDSGYRFYSYGDACLLRCHDPAL